MDADDFPKSSVGDMIDNATIRWFRVDGVDFEMWRAVFDIDRDETILDVWRQGGDEDWSFDISTEVYGEIATGTAMTLEGAKTKALEAAAIEYPAVS